MCDSQAAIIALKEVNTLSNMEKRTNDALNRLGENYKICIKWIKAHVNHKGNEIADRAAKTGSQLQTREDVPLSQAFVKDLINKDMYEAWNRRWQTQGDCRQTFLFFP